MLVCEGDTTVVRKRIHDKNRDVILSCAVANIQTAIFAHHLDGHSGEQEAKPQSGSTLDFIIRGGYYMDLKLFDAELKVMDVLWCEGDTTAKRISDILTEKIGWNINTTYTLINRCIKKGAIERSEPRYMCRALVAKEAVQETETDELINKIYGGSENKLFAALVGRKKLSPEQIGKLKQIVGDLE